MSVEELRVEIDSLDARLVELLRERLSIVRLIAIEKRTAGIAIRDPEREREIVGRVPQGAVRDAYRAVVEACREAAVRGADDGRDPSAEALRAEGR